MPPAPKINLDDLPVERVPIGQLKPDPNNARAHSEHNLTAIERSLRRFGQRKPLVVDRDYVVVAGNGTLEVLRDRIGAEQVWVTVFPGTTAEARSYAIADNRTGELASWNADQLLESLNSLDADLLAASGYDTDEVEDLTARFGVAPDLDHLLTEHGEPVAEVLWPTLRLRVPPPLLSRYQALIDGAAADDADAFARVLGWAEEAKTRGA